MRRGCKYQAEHVDQIAVLGRAESSIQYVFGASHAFNDIARGVNVNAISRNAYALPKSEPKIVHRNECDNDTRARLMILLRQPRVPLEDIAIFTERLLGKFHERIVGLSDLIDASSILLAIYFNVWSSNSSFFTCGRKT